MTRHRRSICGLVFVGMFAVGCSNASNTSAGPFLSGKVSYKGAALNYGTLIFRGEDGKLYKSVILTDGTYRTKTPPPGTYQVGVDTSIVPAGASGGGGPGGAPPKRINLPSKVKDPATSDLKVTITNSTSTLDITIPESTAAEESKEPPKEESKKEESKKPVEKK
jgi:hypothetical protein